MSMTFYAAAGRTGPVVSDLDLNVSNDNAHRILSSLGYAAKWGLFDAPIDEFIARTSLWLQQNIDRPSAAVPDEVHAGKGATLIECGLPENYLNMRIKALVDLAQAGRRLGATHLIGT